MQYSGTAELIKESQKTARKAREARKRMAETLELAWIVLMEARKPHRSMPISPPGRQ